MTALGHARPLRLVPTILLGIAVVWQATMLVEWRVGAAPWPDRVPMVADLPVPLTGRFEPPEPEAVAALVERPLFDPSRRPAAAAPAVEPAAPAPATAALPIVALHGIFRHDGRPRALVRTVEGGPSTWVGVGDRLQGWTVEAIAADTITLGHGGQQKNVQLHAR